MSKTPKFDKALDEILKDLKPNTRICKTCSSFFEIFKEDIGLYNMLHVPPPTLCPPCRMKRRMISYLRLPPFYKKQCSAPGHSEKVISMYPVSSPHKIYDNAYWRSDAWDPQRFKISFDLQKDFFSQFKDLFFHVPHQAIFVDPQSVNSEYSIGGVAAKGCYYAGSIMRSENIFYSWGVFDSRDCIDLTMVFDSELVYECISSNRNYNCNFCMDVEGCTNSMFLFDCKGCHDCFMSSNLRNKSYYFHNQRLSRENYQIKVASLSLEKRSTLNKLKQEFEDLKKVSVHRNINVKNAIDSIGDELDDCKNCYFTFQASDNCENLRYVQYAYSSKDLLDVSGVVDSSLSYESAGSGSVSNALFSFNLRNCALIEYSANLQNCEYCFGCIGLKNKKFCIFNAQYNESSYWEMLDNTKLHLLRNKDYGEFFPVGLGLAPYQNTLAQIEFPLNKKEAEKQGISWYEDTQEPYSTQKIILASDVPETIFEVDNSTLEKAIICEVSQKPFRIIPQELDFYRKKQLPLPTKHPDVRMRERFDKMRHMKLWRQPCFKCGQEIYTSYDPKNDLKVYCEECYQREVV